MARLLLLEKNTSWCIIEEQDQSGRFLQQNVLLNQKGTNTMYTNEELQKKTLDAIKAAHQSPSKHIRISWTPRSREIVINDQRYTITQASLVCKGHNRTTIIPDAGDNSGFILAVRPKKYMALVMDHASDTRLYSYTPLHKDLEEDPVKVREISDLLICVVETDSHSTFVIAFVDGIYFLQSFDDDYTVTLRGVFQAMLNICQEHGKGGNTHEQEAQEDQPSGI